MTFFVVLYCTVRKFTLPKCAVKLLRLINEMSMWYHRCLNLTDKRSIFDSYVILKTSNLNDALRNTTYEFHTTMSFDSTMTASMPNNCACVFSKTLHKHHETKTFVFINKLSPAKGKLIFCVDATNEEDALLILAIADRIWENKDFEWKNLCASERLWHDISLHPHGESFPSASENKNNVYAQHNNI